MANPGDEFPAGEDYLSRRMKDLERRVSENASSIPRSFQTTVDSLNATIAALAVQVARIDAQVASIAAVVNAQVAPRVGSAGNNSYTLTTSYATYASFSFTVPSGFTQVYINAGGSMTAVSQAAAGDLAFARILINGTAGTEGRSLFSATAAAPAVPAFATLGLPSLTAGATILVEIQGRLNTGPGLAASPYASISVSGTALFIR